MNTPNDGGPAMPYNQQCDPFKDTSIIQHPGMSLRAYAAIKLQVPDSGIDWLDEMIRKSRHDWFAGQALAGLMVNYHDHPNNTEECANLAFDAADATLSAREKANQTR